MHFTAERSTSTLVNIMLADVNDNSPVFDPQTYNITVYEDLPIGTALLNVQAFDEDQGKFGEVAYRQSPKHGSNFFRYTIKLRVMQNTSTSIHTMVDSTLINLYPLLGVKLSILKSLPKMLVVLQAKFLPIFRSKFYLLKSTAPTLLGDSMNLQSAKIFCRGLSLVLSKLYPPEH